MPSTAARTDASEAITTVPLTQDVVRALEALGPLTPGEGDQPRAFRGRPYEYVGRGDPLAEEMEKTTSDLEGLCLRPTLEADVNSIIDSSITTAWIEKQVDAAILQSAPERLLAELPGTGALIFPPPPPVARVHIPTLSFGPLTNAVDADARRLARDPAQQQFRLQALLPFDRAGRILNTELALLQAAEVAEHVALGSRERLDAKDSRRLFALSREHARRVRYASAFCIAVKTLTQYDSSVNAPQLFHAFDAVAGLDKAPFRRGPSEHLTPSLLAAMAVEFYRALRNPSYIVSFAMLTFPIKNSSGLRTNVATEAADLGEVLMLAQFRRMLRFLTELGFANVRFVCLTDGIVYSRYLGPYDRSQAVYYRENVRHFRSALGLEGRVLIVDAVNLLDRIPYFDVLLRRFRAALDRAESESALVKRKITSLVRSFLFHIHTQGEDLQLLARIVNASIQGKLLDDIRERAEQRRIWQKADEDARWYASHLLAMSALNPLPGLVDVPYIRATVHPKPGQFAPASVNVRDFSDMPYHRKPLLPIGANPLALESYVGANLWADPQLRYVDVHVGQNRSPFLGIRL